jgi:iron complex outermembrane receptor protein
MPPRSIALIALLFLLPNQTSASEPAAQDLKRLSIEQLMQIDVTLAARRPEPIATAPTVVTGDDIRRAGATTLADAVALADGVHVARFNNGTWSSPRAGSPRSPRRRCS